MATHALMVFALSVQASALDLATCQAQSLWLTVPVEKAKVEGWLKAYLLPADRQQVVLEDAPGYENTTQHPVQIELDSFHSCKSLGGIPYPSFNEVAAMIPYVRWQNKTGFHFQPWAIVSNIFGASSMLLLGARHFTEQYGGAQYSTPHYWTQMTSYNWDSSQVKSMHGPNDPGSYDPTGRLNVSAHVGALIDSTLLESYDTAWREMVTTKRTKKVNYANCGLRGTWKYSCNRIQWDIQKAAKVTEGEFVIDGVWCFFPGVIDWVDKYDTPTSISSLRKMFPGFEVYAAQTTMTAVLGCGSENEVIV